MGAGQQNGERFASLDYIRGLSILGILAVNALAFAQPFSVYMEATATPVPLTHADNLAWWAVQTFAREKFITLFSMLFGVSLFLVGETNPPRAVPHETPLFRRLAWLLVFGVVHGAVIWMGDVLLLYAVTGFAFWQWRTRSAGWLLGTGVALYLVNFVAPILADLFMQHKEMTRAAVVPDLTPLVDLMRSDLWGSLQGNFKQWADLIVLEVMFFLLQTLSLMMIGLGLFKAGFLKNRAPSWTYWLAVVAGGACLAATGVVVWRYVGDGYHAANYATLYNLLTNTLPPLISLGYAAGLMLLARTAVGGVVLYPLRCAGRMAFTNYLCQSLIMTGLFYGGRGPEMWGLPWYGQMNTAGLMPIVGCILAGQLVFSMLWLTMFRYGPFEWAWRCLTYQRWVGILR